MSRGVEVLECQSEGCLPARCDGEGEKQPDRVAVGGDRVRAGLALADEPVGEERLQCRGDRAHRCVFHVSLQSLGRGAHQLWRGRRYQ